MASNQEKLDYLVSPNFKRDIFTGQDKAEIDARKKFIGEILNNGITSGEAKNGKVTSIADSLRWLGPTFDTIFSRIVSVDAKTDALAAAVAGLAKALPGGESLDVEKLLQSIEDRVAAGTERGLKSVETTITLKKEQ